MFSKYPATEQFRHVINSVKKYASKRDEELPVLKFTGTVKLHGMNAAIGYRKVTGHWYQSRNNEITQEKDVAGFVHTMHPLADEFFTQFILPQSPTIREQYEYGRKIVIFGEWCGGKIQKNVAISDLPKMFVIIKVKVCEDNTVQTDEEDEERNTNQNTVETDDEDDEQNTSTSFWLQPKDWSHIKWHEKGIYNIYDFPTYEIDINFETPNLAQNKLIEITETVERQCPVGTFFKKTGIGEGVVWTEWEQSSGVLNFKVKGEKHSVSKVATLAPVDTEKLNDIQGFIEYACTEHRMLQGLDYLREQQLEIEIKNFGTFLKWVVSDIIKEEKDTMDASGINSKDVWRVAKNTLLPWFRKQTFRSFMKS